MLAAHAGLRRPMAVDGPASPTTPWAAATAPPSPCWQATSAKRWLSSLSWPTGRALTTPDGEEVLQGVTLDPFGINVFKGHRVHGPPRRPL